MDLAKLWTKDKDIRRTVHRICNNDISVCDIQPGQSILIPIN